MSSIDATFLPEEKLPECWKDETRINVLFAPSRNRSVNPKDWDSKFLFWKNIISIYCVHHKTFTFKLSALSKAFNRNGRSPACLSSVVDELYRTGELKTLDVFSQRPAETWSTWAADALKKPVRWSFNKIKNTVMTGDADLIYVHVYAVETEAEKLIENVPEKLKNKVVSLKELSQAEQLRYLKIESLKILLHHLLCTGKASIREMGGHLENTILIKICDVKKHGSITNVDVDVYTLEQSEAALIKDVQKLENEVLSLITDAKSYLIKGHRQTAKTCLRKKRDLEKCIEKRANALNNIQTLLSRIQDLDSDVQVLDSYKTALSRLRNTFSETGLTEEMVSNTMLELDEVLEMHGDIQSTLAQTNLSNVDGDLEAELAELIASDEEEKSASAAAGTDGEDLSAALVEELKVLDIKLPSPPSSQIDSKAKMSM